MSVDDDQGNWTTGWRIMVDGTWTWWHGNAPHCSDEQLRDLKGGLWRRLLRMLEPAVPACPCCYYTYAAGYPPSCGWYVGNWSHHCRSYSWIWSHHNAPHFRRLWFVPACHVKNTSVAWLFPEAFGGSWPSQGLPGDPGPPSTIPWFLFKWRLLNQELFNRRGFGDGPGGLSLSVRQVDASDRGPEPGAEQNMPAHHEVPDEHLAGEQGLAQRDAPATSAIHEAPERHLAREQRRGT